MKKHLKNLKHKFVFVFMYLSIKIRIFARGREKVLFLIGTPIHGNLGDQAIALAETNLIKNKLDSNVIEIPSPYALEFLKQWKKIIDTSRILIHGGGFMGSLWPVENALILEVIQSFKSNRVIILPQTVFFQSANMRDEIKEYQVLLKSRPNVTLCVREEFSYHKVVDEYQFPNVVLIPDMVTYLESDDFKLTERSEHPTKALVCLRKDIEKIKDSSLTNFTTSLLTNFQVEYTDTVIQKKVYPRARKKEISEKLQQFKDAEFVVTDRLHGMVFSAIVGTPCLVLPNNNYKIIGVYQWIANNRYIVFADSKDKVSHFFDDHSYERKGLYDNSSLNSGFDELVKLIGGRDDEHD